MIKTLQSDKSTVRNDQIDIFRGWLILFVIIGHVVLGSVHDNVIRYSIYAFHMPLFIGLSGYLINPITLKQSSFLSVIKRYWYRVLIPFFVAFIFYTGVLLVHAYTEGRLNTTLIASYLHTPYYHLWFIPTLLIWVITFWMSLKLNVPLIISLSLCFAATVLWASIPTSQLWSVLALILSKKVAYFFLFFIFGAYIRVAKNNKWLALATDFKVLPMTVILACAFVYIMAIGDQNSPIKGFTWLLMNLLLIVVCTNFITSVPRANSKGKKSFRLSRTNLILAGVGRNSLPIYLWHVAPLFVLKGFDIHQSAPLLYYAVSVVTITLLCATILFLENKNRTINMFIFGT